MPRDLPIGNGTVLINFDLNYGLRDIYFPHVGQQNHTVGHLSRLGVYADGEFSWVGPDWQIKRNYLSETMVTDVSLRSERLGLEIRVNDTVDFYLWVFLRAFSVRDLKGRARDVRLFFNHDFHISENEIGDTAYFDPQTRSLIHYKGNRWFLLNLSDGQIDGVNHFACGKKEMECLEGTWKDAEDGVLSGSPIAQGSVDSTIGINLNVAPNASTTCYFWMCFGTAYEKVVKLNNIVCQKRPERLIKRTENYWRLWVNKDNRNFQDLPESTVNLFKQSLLMLATNIDEDGAIIAGADEDTTAYARDTYSYMWPRDGALTAYALTKANYRTLGQNFFKFCLDVIKESGYFLHKYNPDKTVASSWLPWWRQGQIELPIQEDETALVVWSLWQHFEKFRDVEMVKPLFRRLITNAADFLIEFRDPETKLPYPSWDLWEERYAVNLFTVAAVIGGLEAAAKFAERFGEGDLAQIYMSAQEEVRKSMLKYMWSPEHNCFARAAERTDDGYKLDMTVDAANYGIFAFGALAADDPKVVATMEAIYDKLWVKSQVGGVARYENDTYYQIAQEIDKIPGNPWFISTLWLAQWHIASAKSKNDLARAREIFDWVAKRALTSGVLAEQVNPYTDAPLSVSPLTWSHGTYVAAVCEYLDRFALLS